MNGYVAISLDTPQLAAGSFISFVQLHPGNPGLDIHFIHQSWECDALSDVFFAGEPGDGSLYAEAEAAMRHQPVAAPGSTW